MAQVQWTPYQARNDFQRPVVLDEKKHWTSDLGGLLSAVGVIPGQMQEAKLKQQLNDMMLQILATNPTITETTPASTDLKPGVTLEEIDVNNPPTGFSVFNTPESYGNIFTETPEKTVTKANPKFTDIARKLEVLGVYKPTAAGGTRYETPAEEAYRAGLKEQAIQLAKAPERAEARTSREEQAEEARISRERIAEENRLSREQMARDANALRQEIAADRANNARASAESLAAHRELLGEIARRNADTAAAEAARRGEQDKSNRIKNLQEQLTVVQNQLKTPPATTGGRKREWNMSDKTHVDAIKGYVQQHNALVDQLANEGVIIPDRKELVEVERNAIAKWLAPVFGQEPVKRELQSVPNSRAVQPQPPKPTAPNPPKPAAKPPTKSEGPTLSPEEIKRRADKILGIQ